MWAVLAGVLVLAGLDVAFSPSGSANFSGLLGAASGAGRWFLDPPVPGIPNLHDRTALPGQGGKGGEGGLGGSGVAGAGGAGASTALPGTAPGAVLGPGALGIGGPVQVYPPGTHGGASQGYAGSEI